MSLKSKDHAGGPSVLLHTRVAADFAQCLRSLMVRPQPPMAHRVISTGEDDGIRLIRGSTVKEASDGGLSEE